MHPPAPPGVGSTLDRFRLTALLGEGGMGAVYRATDGRLGREVAIKVLPEAFTADPERLTRFEREARLLAALNHPNIAGIHEPGRAKAADGSTTHFLVMELVEGEDLARRLERGPLALEEALDVARQIAEALDEAHQKGVVHRDLKPHNVMQTPEGRVKVLDFGLAKALAEEDRAQPTVDVTHSPTLTMQNTVAGVILGTAAYMAPEQASGRPTDKRADIWSFGVLVFELLTGRRLFDGGSVPEILAEVLKGDLSLDALPPETPAGVRLLLRRCLERKPAERLRDIGDARWLLDEYGIGPQPQGTKDHRPRRGRGRELAGWVVAVVVAVLFAAALLTRADPPQPHPIRSVIPLPAGVSIELDGERAGIPAVSPDGRRIAIGARNGSGPTRIWVHELATGETHALPETEGAYRPFWSPDGSRIGFFDWGHLAFVGRDGGPVTRLAPSRDARGGTWSKDGTILFSTSTWGPIRAVSEEGGAVRVVTLPSEGDRESTWTHRFAWFLPGFERFLYLDRANAAISPTEIVIGELGDPNSRTKVLQGESNAVFAEGHLLYRQGSSLVARPFDLEALAFGGPARVVVEDLLVNERFSYGAFSAGGPGILAFLTGTQRDLSRLTWRSRTGEELGELGRPAVLSGFGGLSLSPDGQWAAVSRIGEEESKADLWLFDLQAGTEIRLARPEADEGSPIFTSDSGTLFYVSRTLGDAEVVVIERDLATGVEEVVNTDTGQVMIRGTSLVADENAFLAEALESTEKLSWDVVLVPVDGNEKARPLLAGDADHAMPRLSPAGRWLAWSSDESGRYEVFVARFPSLEGRVQVSRGGGTEPLWNPAGGELFYKAADNSLIAVPLGESPDVFTLGEPERLFRVVESSTVTYAVSADGERFLVREPLVNDAARQIHLLTDWPAALR